METKYNVTLYCNKESEWERKYPIHEIWSLAKKNGFKLKPINDHQQKLLKEEKLYNLLPILYEDGVVFLSKGKYVLKIEVPSYLLQDTQQHERIGYNGTHYKRTYSQNQIGNFI